MGGSSAPPGRQPHASHTGDGQQPASGDWAAGIGAQATQGGGDSKASSPASSCVRWTRQCRAPQRLRSGCTVNARGTLRDWASPGRPITAWTTIHQGRRCSQRVWQRPCTPRPLTRLPRLMSLTATSSPVCLSRARTTVEKAPLPRVPTCSRVAHGGPVAKAGWDAGAGGWQGGRQPAPSLRVPGRHQTGRSQA